MDDNQSEQSDEFLVVAAIDFGTSRSGYAYGFLSDPDRIYDDQNFGSESRNLKTKTALLMKRTPTNNSLTFHSFGFAAESTFSSGDLDNTDSDADDGDDNQPMYEYFDRIKMNLHNNPNHQVYCQSASGRKAPIELVIAACLQHLKEKILNELNKSSLDSQITSQDVHWVLTVPAIWTPAAKQRMRRAAELAGLAKQSDYRHLTLALEPECAAIECRHFSKNIHNSDLKPGETFIVADCGGGTVDIFTCKVLSTSNGSFFRMAEVVSPSGGPWGSTYIDGNFESFLSDLIGPETLTAFKTGNPPEWLHVRNTFISRKENFAPGDEDRITLKLPDLATYLAEEGKPSLKDLADVYNTAHPDTNIQVKKGNRLRLTFPFFCSFLQPLIDDTVKHIESLLAKPALKDCSYVFLVGGFGESKVLQKAFSDAFNTKTCKLVCPISPDLAVVRGAVRFGLSPNSIASRKARASYGIGSSVPFDPAVHPEDRKVVNVDGEALANGIFDKFVSAGQDVRVGETVQRRYEPLSSKSQSVCLTIYESSDPDVKYTTNNPEARVSGSLRIQFSEEDMKLPFHQRKLSVEFSFGNTEIVCRARLIHSGKEAVCAIEFDSPS